MLRLAIHLKILKGLVMTVQKNYRIRLLLLLLTGLILFGSCPESFAAQQDANEPADFFEMSIEELMEVEVVSASRQAQKMDELSVPVTVITSEDIHYSGLTSIPEILQFATGMDVLRLDRNRYAVGVRGLHDFTSDRTLTLVNGRIAFIDCLF
jgi:iron complex outermembrane receptor protein